LLLVLTFALGLSLGYILHSELFPSPFRDRPFRGGPPGPDMGRGDLVPPPLYDRLVEELNLTPAQKEEFNRILETHRTSLMALRRDIVQPRQRAIMDSTRSRIETLLTPDQLQRFQAFRQKYRREGFREPPPDRPGPPPFDE
jgi:hypothetical protein